VRPHRVFFNSVTHHKEQIPDDATAISEELYLSLLQGESSGKTIGVDSQGRPTLIAPVVDQNAQVNQERAWRDTEIDRLKWLRERHRDEQDLTLVTTLTSEQFCELLAYIQQLRSWPQSKTFPQIKDRPVAPIWITSLAS